MSHLKYETGMPGLCMSRAAARVGVRVGARGRVRSPSQLYKKTVTDEEKSELSNESRFNSYLPESESGNRVMVVIDSSPEAKGALEWALSHTVQNQDTIILLHVAKLVGKTNGEIDQRAYDLLRSTKNTCELKRPEVRVEMALREGHEKGATIVEEARRLKVSLLVLGHKKQSLMWRLHMIVIQASFISLSSPTSKGSKYYCSHHQTFGEILHLLVRMNNLKMQKFQRKKEGYFQIHIGKPHKELQRE